MHQAGADRPAERAGKFDVAVPSGMVAYGITIALSAFLLFLVQPIIAKQILPWFGGSAAVWTTCMMFFQVVLLVGYAYSDFVVRRLELRRQRWLHAVLLLCSLGVLPILLGDSSGTAEADPVVSILQLLVLSIGLPYFVLSTTGPLLQAWFTRQFPHAQVYRLYALSNAASMAALIAYPPLIEPSASVRTQSLLWSAGYALFVALGLYVMWQSRGIAERSHAAVVSTGRPVESRGETSVRSPAAPALAILWFLLSALASLLLLAVTAHLTQNVASVPFLWLLPLALYLLSFILCFDGQRWYRRAFFFPLAVAGCVAMTAGLAIRFGPGFRLSLAPMPFEQAVVVYPLGLFVLCMFLHGELALRRPAPALLTRFYLSVSVGGAAGGVFAALIAPALFDGYFELPLVLLGVGVALLFTAEREGPRFAGFVATMVTATVAGLLLFGAHATSVTVERDFYGVLSVNLVDEASNDRARLQLVHGNTVHGEQIKNSALRSAGTAYFGPDSGVARALLAMRALDGARAQRVGVIGLGIGTLASYAAPGDTYRFFEIDAAVERLARRYFSYLQDSAADVEVEIGDGRLLLQRSPSLRLRLLVIDAFSSDAIPVHLLTEEAMRIYGRHVDPDGAIAFHISNNYLELGPVVRNLADGSGQRAIRVNHVPVEDEWWLKPSHWVIVTSNVALVDRLLATGGVEQPRDPRVAPWTDGYSNLFDVLRLRR